MTNRRYHITRYEWQFVKYDADENNDFDYGDTLKELFKNTTWDEVKKLTDAETHAIRLSVWKGFIDSDNMEDIDLWGYASVINNELEKDAYGYKIPKKYHTEFNRWKLL